MKILFVLAYYHPYIGGAEYLFKRLAEGLYQRGHTIRVITTHLPGTPLHEEINGVEVERVRTPRFCDRCFFSVLSLPNVVRQISEYDLVHTASNNITTPALIAARMYKKPVVFTCHEVLDNRWHMVEKPLLKAWMYRIVERMVVTNKYDRYIAVSKATYDDLLKTGASPQRTQIVYNGVDEIFSTNVPQSSNLRERLGLKPNDFLYLYYGRIGVTKGIDFLVKAAPMIQQRMPNAHLVLILSPEPQNRYADLCQLIESLGEGLNIHIVPRTPDRLQLVQYLSEVNCIVVPSVTEGFGLTTAEACTLRVPVVASRVGSIPEIVGGKYILIEPGSPEAICDGVVRASQGKYDEWKPPKQFSWAKMVENYEKVYQELLLQCT